MSRALTEIAKDFDTTTRAMIWHEVNHKELTSKLEELGSELSEAVAALAKAEKKEEQPAKIEGDKS